MSEHRDAEFWDEMKDFALNVVKPPVGERWPRGSERRHFRGTNSVNSVYELSLEFPHPEHAVENVEVQAPSFRRVRDYVMTWPQFGPWIAFKVGDMLDRVLEVPVDFSNSDVFMFDSPREAAELWAGEVGPPAITRALSHLQFHLGEKYLAPPLADRPVALQEYETILCKWKSHQNGHYEVGKDIHEIRHALTEWKTVSRTADILLGRLDAHTGVLSS
jgi:hypothetical protein